MPVEMAVARFPLRVPVEREGWRGSRWSFEGLCGRVTELSGGPAGAPLSLSFSVVLDAQRQGEPVAWIAAGPSLFFPPDVAESGVDLEALALVRVRGSAEAGRAADRLLRSGGFGLVVVDLGPSAEIAGPLMARLVQLARRHATALLCLTEKRAGESSLSPLVSLRVESVRERVAPDRFRCELRVLKDKRWGPHWGHREICRGPSGLR